MAKRYLDAGELFKAFKGFSNVDLTTGIKDDFHDVNDLIQQRKLQYFHWQRKEMLMQERVQKRAHLSFGVYDKSSGKVFLIKNAGKFWKNFGHQNNLLMPEEALFLVDQGLLEIKVKINAGHQSNEAKMFEQKSENFENMNKHNDLNYRPMSLQECYHVLLNSPSSPGLDSYLAYSHLSKLGYVVRRHDNNNNTEHSIDNFKRKFEVDAHKNKDNATKKQKSENEIEDSSHQRESELINKANKIFDMIDVSKAADDILTIPQYDWRSGTVVENIDVDVTEIKKKIRSCLFQPTSASNTSLLNAASHYFECYDTGEKQLSPDIDAPLIDPNENLKIDEIFNRLRIHQTKKSEVIYNKSQKNKIYEVADLSLRKTSAVENRWKDYDKDVIYDVYLPDSGFKKSQPGKAAFRLRVLSCRESQLNHRQILEDVNQFNDSCSNNDGTVDNNGGMMYAVVIQGEISFLSLKSLSMSPII